MQFKHRSSLTKNLATLLAILLAATASVPAALTDGLTHHWNFDEGPDWHDAAFGSVATVTNALDLAGGWDASLENLSGSNWVSGRQFTCVRLPGSSAWLDVGQNLASELGGTASLSFWLRTTQAGGASEWSAPGIAGAADNTHAGGIQWGWLDTNGCLALSADGTLLGRTARPVNDGKWHFVVLTRDAGSGAAQVYLDGGLSDARIGPAGNRALAFRSLGRIESPAGNASVFAGRLDEVTVFSRVITASEVLTLGTNCAPKTWDLTTEGVNHRPFTTASVFARAYDVERDPISMRAWTQPLHGSVTYNGDGSFTYSANAGYLGKDSFAVVVQDGQGGFHRSMMNVAVMSEPPGGGGVPVTQFTNFAALQAAGTNLYYSGWRIPRAVDWNRDGKTDLVIGAGGYVWLHTNVGTAAEPAFAPGVKVQAAGADIYAGTGSSPITLADMTGDGVADLVLADSSSKLRVYRNTAGSNAAPVYAAYVTVKNAGGTDFVLPDRRFDLGDWDGDGKPDLVTGTFSGDMKLYLNAGTGADPRFNTGATLVSDSYQLYPRLYDLNGNGLVDFLRGINWGSIVYWRDAGTRGLVSSATLNLTDPGGASPDLHALTDGAMVDFGDFNGDGVLDLLVGGHASSSVYLAFGKIQTIEQSLAAIEAIYDANPADVGVALSANTNALLNVVNNNTWNLISYLQNGTLGTREALYAALTNHIGKYGFLKYQALDTASFHHVPSIALQNWVLLEYALADTPTRRTNIADVMGLTGTMRMLFLETGLGLGDNGQSYPATYGTIRDFQRRHPRELFPDAILTTDQLYGDGRGGFVWTPNSTKNTFGQWALGPANEWAGDLTTAIEKVLGAGAASGDYFTFVMGHEVCHSLDGYVNGRANKDLRRRWGLMLCTAAGPDVIPGADGWWDWTATKSNFQAKGYWDGVAANWNAAWSNYWATGVGAPFRNLSFMRGGIDWFMGAPQESLATQANHHWANGPGRLIGAVDRFRRAGGAGLGPLKANINEVATFIDYLSAGMNRVNLVETKYQASPEQVNWLDHYADLERDDRGYIQRITVDGQTYDFTLDANGVVTDVNCSVTFLQPDAVIGVPNVAQPVDVTANDSRLDGKPVVVESFTQPAHGAVTNGNGRLWYVGADGYNGMDSFTYQAGSSTATVLVTVPGASQGAWTGGGTNDNWNVAANWYGASPTNGQALAFLGSLRLNNTNNLLTSAGQVSLLNGGFNLKGNALTLKGGLLNIAGGNTWAINSTLGNAQSLVSSNGTLTVSGTVTTAGYTLTADGPGNITLSALMTGAGGLTKNGAGTLTISANNNYSGATVVNGGKLLATGGGWYGDRSVGSGPLTINAGAVAEFTQSHGFGVGPSGKSVTINGGTLKLDGDNYINGFTLTGGTINSSGNYVAPQTGTYTVNASASSSVLSVKDFRMQGAVTLNVANGAAGVDLAFSGVLSGNYGFTKSGAGLMQFSASSTYTGTTTVSGGTLQVDGSLGTNTVTIQNTATLGGSGSVPGAVTFQSGATVSPGAPGAVGTLSTGSETWNGGGRLLFHLNDASDSSGWDRLNIMGSLAVQATAGNKFTVSVGSLTPSNTPGPLKGFNNRQSYEWPLAITTAGVQNFAANAFAVETAGFADGLGGGKFSIGVSGNALVLNFTPAVPPVITNAALISNGVFSVTGSGTAGQSYALMTTSNPAPPTIWTSIATNTADTSGFFSVSDPQAANFAQRFYRLQAL